MEHDITMERGLGESAATDPTGTAPEPHATGTQNSETRVLAAEVAAVLGETRPPPIRIITHVMDCLGPNRVHAVLMQNPYYLL